MRGLRSAWLGGMRRLRRIRRALARRPLSGAAPGGEADAPALEQGEWTEAQYAAAAPGGTAMRQLAYWLYMPTDTGTADIPMVVMLHGCEQTAEQFARGTRMNRLAEEHGFAVLYPEQLQSAHPYRCWHWYDPAMDKGGGEADWIAGLIEKLIAERPIDSSRVYAAGLSAGGGMAAMVALRSPHLIAAVGVHSGVVVGAAQSAMGGVSAMRRGTSDSPGSLLAAAVPDLASFPGMPAILLHGASDDVVLPVNTDQLVEQFLLLNGLLTTEGRSQTSPEVPVIEKITQHDVHWQHDYYRDGELKVRVCRIPELEHAWSGGDEALPFNSDEGPDASALMWAFFSKHRRARSTAYVT